MTLTARILTNQPSDEAAWDRFVTSSDDGTVFHLLAWRRVVHEVFRHAPHYLLATDGQDIQGVLPLFEVRGILTGRVLVSTPYSVYGGLCTASPDAARVLHFQLAETYAMQGYLDLQVKHFGEAVKLWRNAPRSGTGLSEKQFKAMKTSANHSGEVHGAPGIEKEKTSLCGTARCAIIHCPVAMCQ